MPGKVAASHAPAVDLPLQGGPARTTTIGLLTIRYYSIRFRASDGIIGLFRFGRKKMMMRKFIFLLMFAAAAGNGQDAGSTQPVAPGRHYDASAATARGIRPDKDGKFQNLEVLWPLDVPVDYCYWRGIIQAEGGPAAAIAGSGMMDQSKATLSLDASKW